MSAYRRAARGATRTTPEHEDFSPTPEDLDAIALALRGLRLKVLDEPAAWLDEPARMLGSDWGILNTWGVGSDKAASTQRELGDGTIELTGLAPGTYVIEPADGAFAKPMKAQVQAGKNTPIQMVVDTDEAVESPPATQPATRPATQPASAPALNGAGTQPVPTGHSERIAALIERLGASDFKARQAAQEALVQIGPEAVPALRAVADGTDPERAPRAKQALASIARRGDRVTSILDVRPPFTFTIRAVTMQGKPQAGVRVRCVHPRPARAKPLVDMVVPTDANGVATFTVNSADLLADRHFWISLDGREFLGDGVRGLSPIERRLDSTWVVLPTRPFKMAPRCFVWVSLGGPAPQTPRHFAL